MRTGRGRRTAIDSIPFAWPATLNSRRTALEYLYTICISECMWQSQRFNVTRIFNAKSGQSNVFWDHDNSSRLGGKVIGNKFPFSCLVSLVAPFPIKNHSDYVLQTYSNPKKDADSVIRNWIPVLKRNCWQAKLSLSLRCVDFIS